MDSGRCDNGEVNGSTVGTVVPAPAVVATYKTLPDADINWQEKQEKPINATSKQPIKEANGPEKEIMGKQNGENEIDDGAAEKMLKDEAKISIKDATEVKFISENGDAKIDIETIKQTFSGMGKEELMKFANDPFWIKLRWVLFVGFWMIWLLMLAGAIAIIVMAPKCSAPQPKKWWEESPIIQLDAKDSPTKDLKGFITLLDDLQEKNIKAISLTSIIKDSSSGHYEDFQEVKVSLGSIENLKELVKAAKERDQHIILDLDPNHSSVTHPWFKLSVQRKDPYTDYYVWADARIDENGQKNPPNNWLSKNNESAWEWNEERGQYYYHAFNKTQPDLNYNNTVVVAEFSDVLKHWLKLGISGFRLANIPFLTEDPALRSESVSSLPTIGDSDYNSLVHVYTRDRPENVAVLQKWFEVVQNETEGTGLFAWQDNIGADILAVFNEKKIIHLPQSSQFLANADININATVLQKNIGEWLNISSWPTWDLNGKERPLRKRVPTDVADSLTLMTLLLPGTPILKLNDTTSAKEAFTLLSKARSGLTFLYGETTLKTVNGSVFVYTRLKSGNPGYIVAYNTGRNSKIIDLSVLSQVADEVNVFAYSPNYIQGNNIMRTKLPANEVPISPKSTVVLTFVPKA
ncbi:amino acid transporter heavy chain SLC3A1 [Prorops nasuta]|uniref:amino acid transporter heavy chain SLC3A1 n=1 Tax=Prorops nasuta TaxID=863751 RepID=UPI0034CE207A